jgi:hypothetical protein
MVSMKLNLPTRLRIFEEMDVVTTKSGIQGKLKNLRLTYIVMGYSVDQTSDVYRKLNLNSKRIIQKRCVFGS